MIAISQNTRNDILRLFPINPAKVYTIPYGIASIFRPVPKHTQGRILRKYGLPEQFVLYVGNLEPRKNLPMLLRAFNRLVQRGLPHALVLAGSRGWMNEEVFATLRELNLGHRVFLPGYIPQTDLPALYSAASLFVYVSLYEGFGLPVLEAISCGVPVITSKAASMPEIVGSGGVLIDPNDESELTDAMSRVLTDDDLRTRLTREGLERSRLFSWERAAQETLAIYQRVAVQAI